MPPKLIRGNFNLDYLKPKALPGQDEDVNMGNLHLFGKTIINTLNIEITSEGYRGGKLVWHNDETGNPFSPGFDVTDKPIFVHPVGDVIQIHSLSELRCFYGQLRREGYAPEYSPAFGF
ncbi:DNA gyrase [Enterobacter sp. Cy-643]|uniref:DNA gyrase n=1 Tax=Enterobacter sp. Cy-643 TaxID=2608346 RepID=UPI003369CFDE